MDNKVLALSLYKQSGRAYGCLSTFFALQSRRTWTTFLNKIPFTPGINTHIFEHLQSVISHMKACYRYCTLKFDEISLSTGLQYNQKLDVVEGFVDHWGVANQGEGVVT